MVEIEVDSIALVKVGAAAAEWKTKLEGVFVDRGNLHLAFRDVQHASSSYGIDHKQFQGQQVQDPTSLRIYHPCSDQVDHTVCKSSVLERLELA